MKTSKLLVPVFTALLVSACGGGSSGGGADTIADNDLAATPDINPNPAQAGDLLTGRFVDSAVTGLQYETESQSGVTGADGTFSYTAGETVTFSIGDISLPAIPGAGVVTPLDVFSTNDILDTRVMNLARLLQTLDTNADPTDGITLSDAATASATGLEVDFASTAMFESQVGNLIANSGSSNIELVEGMEALEHLQETLFIEGIEARPPPPTSQEQQPSSGTQNTATHPLVGTSAEFSDFAHDVSGTLTVIDDRTLEVSNFNYDGGGVVVFFYYGTDGNFRDNSPDGAGPIGPQLNGTPFTNETITLTLPDGLTLDDFNSLSVWCVPFGADFGSAQL